MSSIILNNVLLGVALVDLRRFDFKPFTFVDVDHGYSTAAFLFNSKGTRRDKTLRKHFYEEEAYRVLAAITAHLSLSDLNFVFSVKVSWFDVIAIQSSSLLFRKLSH